MKRTLRLLFLISSVASAQQEIPLWINGAPGFESRKNEPQLAKDWWVKNIHNPSITVYLPPKEIATGAAVLICPGGGHRELVFNPEGVDPAIYLNKLGVAAIVLKYRLAREEKSPYTIEEHVKADAFRAMRQVRANAKAWNIDPNRVGMMGFSAGGEVVTLVAYQSGVNKNAKDSIDSYNAKPNFQILIYPGPLGIPETVPKDSPPAFLLGSNDDPCCSEPIVKLVQKYREAKIPMEAHLFAQGAHGYNMGYRSSLQSIKSWPQRMADWLADSGWLKPGN